ncbi:MAG: ribosomal-processing cysteine protease Prp [Longibaculum sp.]
MIRVLVKTKEQQITQITLKGHANSDEHGKDLICAAVSTTITGIINDLMKRDFFSQGNGCYELDEGFADIIIINSDHDIQVVLETFVSIMETIENSYPEYLKITTREVK